MAEEKVTQQPNTWRTDAEVRDEHDRLATIYRQRGLSVLIETASDEIVKLRRAALEMANYIKEMAGADCHQYDKYLNPRPCRTCDSCRARALLARLDG